MAFVERFHCKYKNEVNNMDEEHVDHLLSKFYLLPCPFLERQMISLVHLLHNSYMPLRIFAVALLLFFCIYFNFLTDLENTLTVSHNGPVLAGTILTLTCKAVVSRSVRLQWLNSDGSIINSTSSVTVSDPDVEGRNTAVTLTFNPLKTAHAGNYSCSCFIGQSHIVVTTSHDIVVQSK